MSAKKNQNQKEKDLDTGFRLHGRNDDGRELRAQAQNDGKGETAPILDCGSGGEQRAEMTAEDDSTMTDKAGDAEQKPLGMTAKETAHHDGKGETAPILDSGSMAGMTAKKLSNSALAARLRFLACNFRALRDRAVMRQELKDLLERC